jgi:PKD repeat protein
MHTLARGAATISTILVLTGCEVNDPVSDGGVGEQLPLADGAGDTSRPVGVDFVVRGCASIEQGACRGPSPLSLVFTAVTFGTLETGEWDFGDGTPAVTGAVVEHTYERPGTYDVTHTVAVGGGTDSEHKPGFIVVEPARAGAACVDDDGCESGVCICRDTCQYPLDSGLCLRDCAQRSCSSPNVCVDLARAGGTEPWNKRLCLPRCNGDQDCLRPGFSCRLAPTVGGWESICLPPWPRDIGAPCRDATGQPHDASCLGGICLGLGGAGYCSAGCTPGSCPRGSRCAQFAAMESAVCLVRCGSDDCDADPQLACELPGGEGAHAFEVLGPEDPAGMTYCSVKRCLGPGECGLTGACVEGFCRATP